MTPFDTHILTWRRGKIATLTAALTALPWLGLLLLPEVAALLWALISALALVAGILVFHRHAQLFSLPLEISTLALYEARDEGVLLRFRVRLGTGRVIRGARHTLSYTAPGGARVDLPMRWAAPSTLIGPWTPTALWREAWPPEGRFTLRVFGYEGRRHWAAERTWDASELQKGGFKTVILRNAGRVVINQSGWDQISALPARSTPLEPS